MWYVLLVFIVLFALFALFAYALCKVSGESDDETEKMWHDIKESQGEN